MKQINAGIKTKLEKVDDKERSLTFIGSNEFLDRDQERIKADGWELENYRKNPVILFAHDKRSPAIAKATRVSIEGGSLVFNVKFPNEGDYPFADTLYKLYKNDFMRATSVGFIPKKWEDSNENGMFVRTFTQTELIELSLVPVPANPTALIADRSLAEAWKKDVISDKQYEEFCERIKSATSGHVVKSDKERIAELENELKEFMAETNGRFKDFESKLKDRSYFDVLFNRDISKGSTAEQMSIERAILIANGEQA